MTPKRLYFISPRDMRKNRADCVHIMKSCQQFAEYGYEVVLVTPRVFRSEYPVEQRDLFQLYGMPETFRVVELPTLLTDVTPDLLMRLQKLIAFGLYYLREMVFGRLNADAVLYGKCYASTFPAIMLRRARLLKTPLFFEKAEFTSTHRWHRFTAENVDGLICINNYIQDKVLAEWAPSRVRLHRLRFPTLYPEIAEHLASISAPSRQALGLPEGKRLVMYAGKIGPSMLEIHYILQAAKLLPSENFVLVGIKEESRTWFMEYLQRNQIQNVTFIGFQPLKRFYEYVNCADLLVSYYDSHDSLSSTQRSPAKACVYLCFGKPVIMADLPSLRERWTDEDIFFVSPDQPALLAQKIRYVFEHPEEARQKAEKCLEFARTHTYSQSYSEVVRFIEACRNHFGSKEGACPAAQSFS